MLGAPPGSANVPLEAAAVKGINTAYTAALKGNSTFLDPE